MFNFRKKKQPQASQEAHPITKLFSDLTQNQRMSVMNLLAIVAYANGEGGIQHKIRILNEYIDFLGVRSDKSDEYLQREGIDRMIDDLITLSQGQKELLVVSAHDIIKCSRQPSEKEVVITAEIFERFGIDEQQFVYICEKSQALIRYFS